jgi:hypothetical protein
LTLERFQQKLLTLHSGDAKKAVRAACAGEQQQSNVAMIVTQMNIVPTSLNR